MVDELQIFGNLVRYNFASNEDWADHECKTICSLKAWRARGKPNWQEASA